MKYWGYARVSTAHQNIERQVTNIKSAYPDAVVVQEVYTGTKIDGRPEWNKLYKMLMKEISRDEETTLIFDEVSRMSRNAEEGVQLYRDLYGAGIHLVFLKEPHINSDTYRTAMEQQLKIEQIGDEDTNALLQGIAEAVNRYILALAQRQITLAFQQAEAEVNYLHKRTSEGIREAKLAGKQIGAVPGKRLISKKQTEMMRVIRAKSRDFDGTVSDVDLIKITGLARNTFYKYKRELRDTL